MIYDKISKAFQRTYAQLLQINKTTVRLTLLKMRTCLGRHGLEVAGCDEVCIASFQKWKPFLFSFSSFYTLKTVQVIVGILCFFFYVDMNQPTEKFCFLCGKLQPNSQLFIHLLFYFQTLKGAAVSLVLNKSESCLYVFVSEVKIKAHISYLSAL